MSQVYITDYISTPDIEKKILKNNLSLKKTKKIKILLVWHKLINKKYLDNFPNIKAVLRYGVGYDNIDLDELKKRNIIFCNNPDYGVEEVSDTALAMILNTVRGVSEYNNLSKKFKKKWQENTLSKIKRTSKLNLGVIGAGRIGTALLLKSQALKFNTFFYDPYKDHGYEKSINCNRCENLEDILKLSDIISIHTPLNNETRGLVSKNFISKMKDNSIFVNTSRGEIVQSLDHLYDGLKIKKLSNVCLDVLPDENLPFKKSKFIEAWKSETNPLSSRIIINPHTSYYSQESYIEMRKKVANNALRILRGKKPFYKII